MLLRPLFRSIFLTSLIALLVAGTANAQMVEQGKNSKAGTTAAKSDPRSLELNEKGVAAMKAGDLKMAQEDLEKALSIDSGNLTAAYNLAGVHLANKKEAEAISLLERYVTDYKKDAGLYGRLGDAYFSAKQLDKAEAAYKSCMALSPRYPDLAAKLGTIYGLQRKYPEAEKMFLLAAEQSPRDVQALNTLSNFMIVNKKPEKAITTAKKALQIKATKESYLALGTAYEMMKDLKNSLISYEKALDLGDTTPELKTKIEGLKKAVS